MNHVYGALESVAPCYGAIEIVEVIIILLLSVCMCVNTLQRSAGSVLFKHSCLIIYIQSSFSESVIRYSRNFPT